MNKINALLNKTVDIHKYLCLVVLLTMSYNAFSQNAPKEYASTFLVTLDSINSKIYNDSLRFNNNIITITSGIFTTSVKQTMFFRNWWGKLADISIYKAPSAKMNVKYKLIFNKGISPNRALLFNPIESKYYTLINSMPVDFNSVMFQKIPIVISIKDLVIDGINKGLTLYGIDEVIELFDTNYGEVEYKYLILSNNIEINYPGN